jgi:3-isopropylmalate/(R)-2-methylmalate dehydratase small subunit
MSIVKQISARAVPVRGNDIDTDRIIPARFLRCVTFDGLGEHAFEDDRLQDKAAGRLHPFDDPKYAGAAILVGNSNFGCGSSREHAPQSLCKWGITAIVAVSFAEIFYNNNIALGVPCLQVKPAEASALQSAIEADPALVVTLDVATKQVRYGNTVIQAVLPDGVQKRFLDGTWDATGQLLDGREAVEAVAAKLPYLSGFIGSSSN